MRKFWICVAVLGVFVSIAGLVLTIVLTDETGEVRPDSECSSAMRASVTSLECVVSNDPKVLLGVAPLLLGFAMVGVGIWRAIASPASGGGGGGLFGNLRALQQQAMQMQESAMGTMSAGDVPRAPTTPPGATPPPPSPAPPPTPPAPTPPGE